MHTTMTTVSNDRKLVILHLIDHSHICIPETTQFVLKQKLVVNTVMYVYKYMYVCM